jgi:hypothetical protein
MNKITAALVALSMLVPAVAEAQPTPYRHAPVAKRTCLKRVEHRHGAIEYRKTKCKSVRRGRAASAALPRPYFRG